MRDRHELEELDEIDRLFMSRLDRAPVPDDLTARVLASTVHRADATRAVVAWPWIVAGVAAIALLTLAGYQLGASLATSDGLELVSAVFDDLGLLMTAPGDVLAALGEFVPWSMVVLAGVSAGFLILAVGNVVSRVPSTLRSRPAARVA
jgi:hypothetical protein